MGVKNIFLLDFGVLSGELGWFLPDPAGWTETMVEKKPKIPVWTDIPVTGAVIEHSDGIVLMDTGSHPEARKVWGPVWEVFPMTKFTDENRLENQLRFVGLKPEDVTYVVFTHLHLDHAGQAYIFKDLRTPLIAHKKELMWATYLMYLGKVGAYQPVDLESLKGGEWFTFEGETFELLPGIDLMFVGGHTPGSLIMKVTTDTGNNYIFTGDFIHLPEELEKESKGWLLGDVDEYITGLRKIKLLAKRPRTNLVISHDPKLWERYPKAPKPLK